MSDETELNTSNLLMHSIEQKPLDFADVFDQLVKDRLADAIADKKIEIAQTIFNPPVEIEDDEEEYFDDETEMESDDEEEVEQEIEDDTNG